MNGDNVTGGDLSEAMWRNGGDSTVGLETAGADVRVVVRGDLVDSTVERLASALAHVLHNDVGRCIVDLTDVPRASAAGIGALAAAGAALTERGGALVIDRPTPHVAAILRLCRLVPDGAAPLWALGDEALLAGVVDRRRPALEEVYRRYAGEVLWCARRALDEIAAADVTVDVFLAVWRDPDRFSASRVELRVSLLRLGHALASHRVGGRVRHRYDDQLAALPAEDRDVLLLAQLPGATSNQIGQLLDLPKEAVRARLSSGLRRLRSNVE